MKSLTFFFISFFLHIFISFLSPAYAVVDIKERFGSKFINLGQLISVLVPNILILAGVIMLFLLIFGGLSVIINAGKGDSQGAGKGKQMVTWAIIGFVLIFAAYWIVQIIEYILGIRIFQPFPPVYDPPEGGNPY